MGQYNNYIFTTPFWEYYGNLPNSGKKLGMNFLLWENIGQKIGKILSWKKIEITILGKYWEILRVHFTCPNFFLDLGNVFPKMGKHWEQSC